MTSDSPETPSLDLLIDEILRGERIVIIAPGFAAFIAANLALTLGAAFVVAPAFPLLLSELVPQAGAAQMLGLAIAIPTIVTPGILTAQGRAAGYRAVLWVNRAWLLAATLAMVAAIGNSGLSAVACGIALGLCLSATLFLRSGGYKTYVMFQQRLRSRRLEKANASSAAG